MSKKLKAGKKAVVGDGHPFISAGSVVLLTQKAGVFWCVDTGNGDNWFIQADRLTRLKKKKKAKAPEQQERLIVVRGFGAITRSQAESMARQRLVDLVDEATFDNWSEVDRLLRVGAHQPLIDALIADDEEKRNVATE